MTAQPIIPAPSTANLIGLSRARLNLTFSAPSLLQIVDVQCDRVKVGHVVEGKAAAEATVTASGAATATEWLMSFRIIGSLLNYNISGPQAISKVKGLIDVSGEDGHLQAITGAVRQFNGLIVTVDGNHRHNRSECLFLIEERVGGHSVYYRGLEEHPRWVPVNSFAAKNYASAFVQGVTKMTFRLFKYRDIIHRTHGYFRMEWITHADPFRFL